MLLLTILFENFKNVYGETRDRKKERERERKRIVKVCLSTEGASNKKPVLLPAA